ncbi:hypothetical protein DXG01_012993 [Tephrocybe rancida]|nr:hypothetical protein DXG01_012993 [Tephrocybe rancida]
MYLRDQNSKPLDDAIAAATLLQTSVYRCTGEILQISGMGKAWDQVDTVHTQVCGVIKVLQDVLLNSMMDFQELQALHARKALRFQML